MDTSKMNLLASINDQNMERNIDNNTEASMLINRRDGPLAPQLANKLSIVTNTNALM
jgi:hypothetical protein